MNKIILYLIVILILNINSSFSWNDLSRRFCRDLNITESSGISRFNEPLDFFIDTYNWDTKPHKDSLKIFTGNCKDQFSGYEIDYSLWNISLENESLVSFNLIVELNVTGNKINQFSIYYDDKPKNLTTRDGIRWLNPTFNWRIQTKNYDLDYGFGPYIGFKNFTYLKEGLNRTNIAGSFSGGQLPILRFESETSFSFVFNNSLCVSYKNYNMNSSVLCRVCYKSDFLICENIGEQNVTVANDISRKLFYDPDSPENLFYRTNADSTIKRSVLTSSSYFPNFRFGVANTTQGTNLIVVVTNGSDFWTTPSYWYMAYNTLPNHNYGSLPAIFPPNKWKRIWVGMTNETLEEAYSRAANWSIAIDYPLENYVTIGPEQVYTDIDFSFYFPKHVFLNQDTPISINASENDKPLENLTEDNFKISLDKEISEILDFENKGNGSYIIYLKFNSDKLGRHEIEIEISKGDKKSAKTDEIILLVEEPERPLVITNSDWQNYISAASNKKPVLVYNSSRKLIDKFIEKYRPDKIFKLGVNLSFEQENFQVDSQETLAKLFNYKTNIIIPSNKEAAIKSGFLPYPILFSISRDTIEYLQPEVIYNFTDHNQLDELFFESSPDPNYFVLINPESLEASLAYSVVKKHNAYAIFSSKTAEGNREELIEKMKNLKLPDSYLFDRTVYLLLVGVPQFFVKNPTKDHTYITTDIPYADLNKDGYLDLSLGRLSSSLESISYQIEMGKIYSHEKTALILSSYNTPGKYWDVVVPGGDMYGTINSEIELLKKGFVTTRLVEKRSEFDKLDKSIIEDLNKIAGELGLTSSASLLSFFSGIFSDINKFILFAKAGNIIMYSLYEFDWKTSWESIFALDPKTPTHLPIFNQPNLEKEVKRNQVILYFSMGNETDWFIPINSTAYSTFYEIFDPKGLDSDALFYYLKYNNSYAIRDKIFSLGSIAFLGLSSSPHNIQSGQTALNFFKNFDLPVGKALLETANRNYELSKILKRKSEIYLKEYYHTILFGDPSLSFDPAVDYQQSPPVKLVDGKYLVEFVFRPNYTVAVHDDKKHLLFNDADDYIVSDGKPAVPIYTNSFNLPSGTLIHGYEMEIKNKTFEDIELPIIYTDSWEFENQTFAGVFPEQNILQADFRLLDNRTVLDILFAPVVYSSDRNVKVFDETKFSFYYTSPLEILLVGCEDTYVGKTARIKISIFSHSDKEANITLRIQKSDSEEFLKKQVSLKNGENTVSIDYGNTTSVGKYSVSAVLASGSEIAGPKYTFFQVKEKPLLKKFWQPISSLFNLSWAGFLKQEKSFIEKSSFKSEGEKSVFDYVSLNMSIRIEQKGVETISFVKTNEGKLEIRRRPGILEYFLETPEGRLHILKAEGNITQDLKGDEKNLRKTLNSIIDSYSMKVRELGLAS